MTTKQKKLTQDEFNHPYSKYIRQDRLPNVWCSGCGIGILLNAIVTAIDSLEIDMDKVVLVSGIGCTGRFAGYFNTDSFHTTHGRAIPLATGIKLANPDLHVIVVSGDGDLFAIGGNHFIHAARRNIDLTVICVNNQNYGMTGGQLGPTSPHLSITTTSRAGNLEHPFNLVQLASSAGAVFVARWTTYHVNQIQKSFIKGLNKNGFSFLEVVSPCPTYFERYNALGDPIALMHRLKNISSISRSGDPNDAIIDYPNKIVCGEFVNMDKQEYSDQIKKHIENTKLQKIPRPKGGLGRSKQ
ncbi:MAG: thiamine pyrophosphate-dependent enzyme [Candidatus Ranarchaeia archaeon]